jgi:hypothetical protein
MRIFGFRYSHARTPEHFQIHFLTGQFRKEDLMFFLAQNIEFYGLVIKQLLTVFQALSKYLLPLLVALLLPASSFEQESRRCTH